MFSFRYFLKKFFPGHYFPPISSGGDQPTGSFPKHFYFSALYAFDYLEARYSLYDKKALHYFLLSLDARFASGFSFVARYAKHTLDALDKTLKFNRQAKYGHLHIDSRFSGSALRAQYQIAKPADAWYSTLNKVGLYD